MISLEYVCWKDGEFYLGYLTEYPSFWTQAYTRAELMINLASLLSDMDEMGLT